MNRDIDFIVEKYSNFINDEIKNKNTGRALVKFNKFKSDLLNSDFESEKKEAIEKIKKGSKHFKDRILKEYGFSKKNSSINLVENPLFLEDLHYYLEYKGLLNKNINEENHSKIFALNGFKLWKLLFKSFKLKDSSRADFRFIYEIMKKDKFIHNIVTQTNMLDWLNDVYEINISKPDYIDINSNHNRNRREKYYNCKQNL